MYVQRRPQVEVGLEDVSTLKELFIVNQDLKKDFLSNIIILYWKNLIGSLRSMSKYSHHGELGP